MTLTKVRLLSLKQTTGFVMFYSLISDPIMLNTAIDVGRAIIYKKLGVDLKNMEVDVDSAIIRFYNSNKEVLILNHDSLNLDNYAGYRLIFDYNLEPCYRVLDMYPNIKNKCLDIEGIPVVNIDFQPLQMLDEVNTTLWRFSQNNIFCLENIENIASNFKIENVKKGIYKSDRFTQYDFIRAKIVIDEMPEYKTKLSFDHDLLKICYMANKLWVNKGYNDILSVLSDGSVRVPVTDIEELTEFETEMVKAMETKVDLYSISLTMEMLEAVQSLSDKGYIGVIGDKKYLINSTPITYFNSEKLEKEIIKISKSRSK